MPFLAAHAFLRYQTIRLQVNNGRVLCHPGWPKDLPIEVPLQVIRKIRVRRGLSGRLFGGGTVVISLLAGDDVVIADLAKPFEAKQAISDARQSMKNRE